MLRKLLTTIAIVLLCMGAFAQDTAESILEQYPAPTTAEAEALAKAWFAQDNAAIASLIGKLLPMGTGDDVAVRFAVSGLAKYVTEPGHEAARARFETVVADALQQAPPEDVAAFLIRQLELAGTDASVPVLAGLLQGSLCGPAAQALSSIGTPLAEATLEEAKASVTDACLTAVTQAATSLKVQPITVEAGPGAPVHERIAALASFMEAGDDALAKVALETAIRSDDYAVRRGALHLATRDAGRGRIEWLAALMTDAPPEVQADIAAALGDLDERVARNVLLDALESEHVMVRVAAIEALPEFGGGRVADVLLERFAAAEDEGEIAAVKGALLRLHADHIAEDLADMLDQVTDAKCIIALDVLAQKQARPQADAVLAQAGAENVDVRVAAQDALSEVAAPRHVGAMLDFLLDETERKGQRHLQDAIVAAVADIEDDDDRAIPVVDKMTEIGGEKRALLMETLPRIAGDPAYEQIMADVPSDDAVVRQAAIEALANWPSTAALSDVLALAKGVENEDERETLLRGYLRIVRESNRSEGKKVQLLGDALDVAATTNQKRHFIGDLSNLRTVGSLQMLVELAQEEALQRQAVSAALNVALPGENYAGLRAAYVGSALTKLMPLVEDEETRIRMEKHIERMPKPDEEGFIELFNGKDLTGWTGDKNGYEAVDGLVVCHERAHGNLYSDLAFSDFILRFEFKLTPGANNGLGIRSPLYGHAAYDGMELQIIDNTAHDDLKPYQYHGSIYGVAPAETGHLKPVGEWNVQEVRAVGPQVTVVLNGTVILDHDLSQWRGKPTPDDKEHPGLHNQSGHIAFLGHGSRVEFRDIKIKELE